MRAFETPIELSEITSTYPSAKDIKKIVNINNSESTEIIIRLWLSEGIPYAFRKNPALYDTIRAWLARKIEINAKEISLTGSARLGESLAPKKIGHPFNENSDLDIFIISESLFEILKKEFNTWSELYSKGIEKPSNNTEEGFWKNNKENTKKNINRGFIDANKIPNRTKYKKTKQIAQAMWELNEKLKTSNNSIKIKKSSIRCYKDWDSHIKQVKRSLSA